MWGRRQILLAAAAAGGSLVGGRLLIADARSAFVTVIRKRLPYLLIDEPGLQRFATDLAAREIVSTSKLEVLQAAAPLYRRIDFSRGSALAEAVRHGEDRIVSAFLLASDFFQNGADETKIVHYVGLHDPYESLRACSAPFARPLFLDGVGPEDLRNGPMDPRRVGG